MVFRLCFDGVLVILGWGLGYVMMVAQEEMVDVLKTTVVSRFFSLSRFVSCYWGL